MDALREELMYGGALLAHQCHFQPSEVYTMDIDEMQDWIAQLTKVNKQIERQQKRL
jgi:hypothetical protein